VFEEMLIPEEAQKQTVELYLFLFQVILLLVSLSCGA
jgi:hypothetical protein